MLQDLVSNLGREEVVWIFILTLGAAIWLVAFCVKQWRRVRQSEIEAALKHDLIERGMSVEDIERDKGVGDLGVPLRAIFGVAEEQRAQGLTHLVESRGRKKQPRLGNCGRRHTASMETFGRAECGVRDPRTARETRAPREAHFLPCTNLFGVPSSGLPGSGRQRISCSIFRARVKSLSVIPPAECVLSLTQTLPHVTARSAWCHAASHRKPTALTSIKVDGQPSVLYFRRSQPSSRYHSAKPSSRSFPSISDAS